MLPLSAGIGGAEPLVRLLLRSILGGGLGLAGEIWGWGSLCELGGTVLGRSDFAAIFPPLALKFDGDGLTGFHMGVSGCGAVCSVGSGEGDSGGIAGWILAGYAAGWMFCGLDSILSPS